MKKQEREGQPAFDYDDQGVTQVSQQIMDSYNSGVIGQEQMTSVVETGQEQQ
ncbi:hypothetical protein V7201_09100 [Bacillus sp. JJ1122]|uniref:hypothetical protein n=1 Tax=Bacillus sp. JJ1122 TaxID=3122951 RepID=UPI00300008FD